MKQIADFLKNFRIKKGLTEEDILKQTTLTKTVIHLIESGDFSSIGAEFYIKSFLKQYCNVIGLTESETDEIIQKVTKSLPKNEEFVSVEHKKNKGIYVWVIILGLILAAIFFFVFKKDSSETHKKIKTKAYNTFKTQTKKSKPFYEKTVESGVDVKNKQGNLGMAGNVEQNNKKEIIENTERKSTMPAKARKLQKENRSNSLNNPPVEPLKEDKITIKFIADCMCWVNISYKGEVIKDFILKENENYSIDVPKGAVLTVGNASCVKIFFNQKQIELGDKKVVRNITVE